MKRSPPIPICEKLMRQRAGRWGVLLCKSCLKRSHKLPPSSALFAADGSHEYASDVRQFIGEPVAKAAGFLFIARSRNSIRRCLR